MNSSLWIYLRRQHVFHSYGGHVEPLEIDKYSNKAAAAHLSGSSVTPDQTNKPDMKPHAPQIQNPHAVSTWWRHIWIAPRVYTFDGSTSFIHKEVWHVEPRKIDTYSNKAAAAHLSGSSVTDWQLGPQSKEDFGILHLQLAPRVGFCSVVGVASTGPYSFLVAQKKSKPDLSVKIVS